MRAWTKAMVARTRIGVFALLSCGALSNTGCEATTEPKSSSLQEGIVAAAGEQLISAQLIERIAHTQGVDLDRALEAALADAVYAAEALSRSHVREAEVQRLALARRLLESLHEEARRQGPPTDAEVRALTEERFWEFDRPEMRRTTHAVVRVEKPEDDARARAVAVKIAEAVADITDAQAFIDAAKKVASEGIKVRAERLAPVAADGRAVDPKNPPPAGPPVARYALDYAAAAFAIPKVSERSPVVRTEFGYHVILLTEVLREKRIPLEERRRLFAAEVTSRRAREQLRALTSKLREQNSVSVERAAIELTEKVRVVP